MELSALDRAISIGALMGEERNLAGMGIVAASAINRSQSPGRFMSQSASLGDVFSAPHTSEAMLSSVLDGVGLSRAGRQYSASINANIPGASTEAYDAFERGIKASLGDPTVLGAYADRYEKASVALDVAVKARDMGIDLGFGTTNYGTPDYAQKAGGGMPMGARFGGHRMGPFTKSKAPSEAEFASRFAAAAALTGVSIPENYRQDIERYATPTQISMAASTMQMQAQQHMAQQGIEAFPGMDYNDVVRETPFGAANVPDFSNQLGINPVGEQGFANTYGITPDNYESMSLPDPVGDVDHMGSLPDLTPIANVDPTLYGQALGPPPDWGAPDFNDFSTDPLQAGFSLPDVSLANFDDVPAGSFPDITAGITGLDPMMDISPVDAAPVNLSDVPDYAPMSQSTFDAAFAAPSPSLSMDYGMEAPQSINSAGMFGRGITPNAPPSVGVGEPAQYGEEQAFGSYTPAPSAAERLSQARIDNFENRSFVGISAPDLDKMAADLQTQLSPTTNKNAVTAWGATPSGIQDFGAPLGIDPLAKNAVGFGSFAPQPQAPAPAFVSTPAPVQRAAPAPVQQTQAPSLPTAIGAQPVTTGALPSTSTTPAPDAGQFAVGKPGGGWMDAMANPDIAKNYSPAGGFFSGWAGDALKGAALGALTGGPLGALIGGGIGAFNLDGRLAAAFSNQFNGFDIGSSWDNFDPNTYGYGEGFNSRGERSHTGEDNSGNATVGDGSHGSMSGRNDNNPQGWL